MAIDTKKTLTILCVLWSSLAKPSNTQFTDFQLLSTRTETKIVDTIPVIRSSRVRATAYNALASQTDDTPDICAWGDKIHPGVVAVSRDLEKCGLTRGVTITVDDGKNIKTLTVKDRMHIRKTNQIDIYMEKQEAAKKFGRQFVTIYWTAGSINIIQTTEFIIYRLGATIFTDTKTSYEKKVLVEDPTLLKFYEIEA